MCARVCLCLCTIWTIVYMYIACGGNGRWLLLLLLFRPLLLFIQHLEILIGFRIIHHRCHHHTQRPWRRRQQQQNGIGDANDIWKIMIVGGRENEPVLTVTSKLLIVHYLQNCALTTSGKQLPKWGYEQQEVSCNPNLRDPNAFWNVEDNTFERCKYIYVECN